MRINKLLSCYVHKKVFRACGVVIVFTDSDTFRGDCVQD